jgi:hypothetical protein
LFKREVYKHSSSTGGIPSENKFNNTKNPSQALLVKHHQSNAASRLASSPINTREGSFTKAVKTDVPTTSRVTKTGDGDGGGVVAVTTTITPASPPNLNYQPSNKIFPSSSQSLLAKALDNFGKLRRRIILSVIARFVHIIMILLLGLNFHVQGPIWYASIMLTLGVSFCIFFTAQVTVAIIQVQASKQGQNNKSAPQLDSSHPKDHSNG